MRRSGVRRTAALALSLLAVVAVVAAAPRSGDAPLIAGHAPPNGFRIASPTMGAVVTGSVVLRAEPAADLVSEVVRVDFRVDGQPFCVRERPPFECEWDAGPSPGVHVIRAAAHLKDGRRLVDSVRTARPAALAPTRRGRFTLSTDVDVVQVVATVTDEQGRFIPNLAMEAFRIWENDLPQPVTHLIGQESPREVVVAVDMSSSMTDAMPQVRQAVRAFLGALRPDDHVTLLAFNDAVFTLARRESDPAARARAVERLAPWGSTALYDMLLKAMDLLATRRGRKVLVVFSDGEDQSSRAALEDVQRRAETNDAPVYMIGQGRGASDKKLQDLLEKMARMSGGRSFHAQDIRELQDAFAAIVLELENQYLLGFQPRNSVKDGSWRRIRVEAGKDHRVRARQGYRAVPRPGGAMAGGLER
jgi:VWFA-related protein